MIPLLFYAVISACAAYSLHKKRWGWLFFACSLLAWIILMQLLFAYMMHGNLQ